MKRFASATIHLSRGLQVLALVLFLALGLTACEVIETQPPPPPDPIVAAEAEAAPLVPPPPPPIARRLPSDGCPPNCELNVTLPSNSRVSPAISTAVMHARSGTQVSINLVDQSRQTGRGATILRFQEAAFVDRNGRPMTTVPLTPGRNVFTVRGFADGACRAETGGCKYDVINTGEPNRPMLDPHVIIWE